MPSLHEKKFFRVLRPLVRRARGHQQHLLSLITIRWGPIRGGPVAGRDFPQPPALFRLDLDGPVRMLARGNNARRTPETNLDVSVSYAEHLCNKIKIDRRLRQREA